ncbi:MAG: penicillin-binding protein 2 [Rhodanobacteraceae bacterium]|nr:penicillin-binding protein 2 [Rhodanobacteraceae bacterium]MBK7044625.1 penicillin-binding protein 2 [Rhodanobacteraceae bacterium]MBP9153309.1 penicillin-binding protein 2 [Xanthomonadales bacterium]HQW82194.1 penicillin-binding protein 2 [Pseudomonadota bacterium]
MRNVRPATVMPRLRLTVVLVALGLCAFALVARAFQMQVMKREFYQDQGDARFLRDIEVPASRGTITDRNGEPLAISTPMVSLWLHPATLLEDPVRVARLAQAMQLDANVLGARIHERQSREFMYLARHQTPEQAARVLALKIAGVHGQREYRRFYPGGEVFAHVLGVTDIDDAGQEGLELTYNAQLVGTPGVKRVIKNRRGEIVENVEEVRAAEPGHTLTLTLDRRIQYLAYRELKAAMFEHSASSGSMVILDIPTGDVLAMVNYPSFNPNVRSNGDIAARRNRAVTDLFEPGSVIKALTVSAGIESGKFTKDTVIDTNPGTLRVRNHIVRDVHNYGLCDLTRLLTKSSNVAATKIALELDNVHLYDMYHRFGFGELTGSGFPGEAPGVLPTPEGWGQVEKATLSYGYGLSVNALQLAQAYAALADGGRLHPPRFVHENISAEVRSLLDPGIAHDVMLMLETVTGTGGSGTKAAVPNYRVAGKTGTARRAVAGGYEGRYVSVFAGVVPVSQPRLAAVVVVNDPRGGAYYGGLVAAPVFGAVMDDAMRLLNVPPDNLQPQMIAGDVPTPAQFAEGVMP